MSEVMRRRLRIGTVAIAILFWGLCFFGAATVALAHPRDTNRIQAVEMTIQKMSTQEESFWEHTWPSLEARLKKIELKQDAQTEALNALMRMIFLATGAMMAFQFILKLKPEIIFKGEKK